MKPTRKLRPRSFVAQVAGVGPPATLNGAGKQAVETDRDLAHPARGGTAQDHDG